MAFFDSIYQLDVSSKAASVYMNLRDRCGVKEECFPSVGLIAHDTKFSERTVYRALKELEKAGVIERYEQYRENASRTTTLYRVKKFF